MNPLETQFNMFGAFAKELNKVLHKPEKSQVDIRRYCPKCKKKVNPVVYSWGEDHWDENCPVCDELLSED